MYQSRSSPLSRTSTPRRSASVACVPSVACDLACRSLQLSAVQVFIGHVHTPCPLPGQRREPHHPNRTCPRSEVPSSPGATGQRRRQNGAHAGRSSGPWQQGYLKSRQDPRACVAGMRCLWKDRRVATPTVGSPRRAARPGSKILRRVSHLFASENQREAVPDNEAHRRSSWISHMSGRVRGPH